MKFPQKLLYMVICSIDFPLFYKVYYKQLMAKITGKKIIISNVLHTNACNTAIISEEDVPETTEYNKTIIVKVKYIFRQLFKLIYNFSDKEFTEDELSPIINGFNVNAYLNEKLVKILKSNNIKIDWEIYANYGSSKVMFIMSNKDYIKIKLLMPPDQNWF